MFRKKKPPAAENGQPVLRGRTASGEGAGAAGRGAANPLARRFQADAEPATVDLAAPARFHPAPGGKEDPKTAPLQTDAAGLAPVISHDPATGKFYIHPGPEGNPVTLAGEPVLAPTELRRGDTIRLGDLEFHFRSRS